MQYQVLNSGNYSFFWCVIFFFFFFFLEVGFLVQLINLCQIVRVKSKTATRAGDFDSALTYIYVVQFLVCICKYMYFYIYVDSRSACEN